MHRHLPRKSYRSLRTALTVSVLCMASSMAFSSQRAAVARIAVTANESATKQAPRGGQNALPAKFRNGLVYVKTTVNDHPDAWMILDTGTTDSMIDSAYARAIGMTLAPKAEAAEGFGSMSPPTFTTDTVRLRFGAEPEKVVFFESIRLGGMFAPNGMPVAGLLGHSFLAGKCIVIDYKREVVYFETLPQPVDGRDVTMTLKNGIPIIALTIAGQSVNALIDTGGTYGMIMTPATANALGVGSLMADSKPAVGGGHGGEQHLLIGEAPPFSIGSLAVHDLSAAYTTFGTATETIGAGVSLGIGFLKKYKLTVNYAANTVRLEP